MVGKGLPKRQSTPTNVICTRGSLLPSSLTEKVRRVELDPWHTEWKDCPFRDRISQSIDIHRFVHMQNGQVVVSFIKLGTGRHVDVLYETIGDNPDDVVLNKIQAYCLDGVKFDD